MFNLHVYQCGKQKLEEIFNLRNIDVTEHLNKPKIYRRRDL